MDELKAALQAAELAGGILRRHFFGQPAVRSKGYRDIVTEADFESERVLKQFFEERFPSYGFLGEETESNFLEDGKNWAVDPLDGTKEFSFGIPHFSVSIALVEAKKVLLGVVHNPVLNDFYHAELGKGAFKNNARVHCGSKTALKESLSMGCFVYSRPELAKVAYATKVFMHNYSPALDLCMVASGRADAVAYSFSTFKDHSAGGLLVKEAGGAVSNLGTDSFNPFGSGVMAANPALYAELRKVFPRPLGEVTYEEKQFEDWAEIKTAKKPRPD